MAGHAATGRLGAAEVRGQPAHRDGVPPLGLRDVSSEAGDPATAEIEVAAQLANKEQKELEAVENKARKAKALDDSVAAALARKDDEVSAEIKSGLNAFDKLSSKDREEYLRQFCLTREAKLTSKRAKVDLENLTETSLRTSELLAKVFGQYIYRKLRVDEGAQLV